MTSSNIINFQPFCCTCNENINLLIENGVILSCGDFICESCSKTNKLENKCPSCGKNVRALQMQENLPDQVKQNTIELSVFLDNLQKALNFQFRHYKLRIKKLGEELNECKAQNKSLKCEIIKYSRHSTTAENDQTNFFTEEEEHSDQFHETRSNSRFTESNRNINSISQNVHNDNFKRKLIDINKGESASIVTSQTFNKEERETPNRHYSRTGPFPQSDSRSIISQSTSQRVQKIPNNSPERIIKLQNPRINQWLNDQNNLQTSDFEISDTSSIRSHNQSMQNYSGNDHSRVNSQSTARNLNYDNTVLQQLRNQVIPVKNGSHHPSGLMLPQVINSSQTYSKSARLPSPSNPQTFQHQSGGLNSPSNPKSPIMASQASHMRPFSNPNSSRIRSPFNVINKPPIREIIPLNRPSIPFNSNKLSHHISKFLED